MLRQSLLYLSQANWARRIATDWPIARRVARRFVAGETMDEALAITAALQAEGIAVTLDYLGESIHNEADAAEVVTTYQRLLDCIERQGADTSISLKLTHLGYDISEDLALANLRHILQRAQTHDITVTIDMESSAYTDATLRLYRTLRDEYGFDNVGTVVQSYLRRTGDDMRALAAEDSHIRLCKGAYLEPASVAFPDKADVDANFVRVMTDFLTQGNGYLCIATHDEAMLQAAEALIQRENIAQDRYEFQMLYGIRSDRQRELAQAGHTMRVYVPFGAAWYPYFVRRLAERPANLWFFARGLFG